MPKVSIITPAYIDSFDKLTWLKEMLLSIQGQSFKDWEVIIIDDCSPQSLEELKREFNDPERFRWVRTAQNGGPAVARNTAAALAEAEALLPVDADDQLADEALARLYAAWQENPRRVVYGDIQRLDGGVRGTIFNLPEYTFQKSLDFNGIMPVTALHSREAHLGAGGWKPGLAAGLEDVEYWIAAGKAGFCGHRISGVALYYRKHETSRSYQLRMVNRRENEMRNKILELHRDVYEGRYPMGCCGGGSSYTPPPQNQSQQMSISTPLTDFRDNEKQWVQYKGNREGSFGIVGDFTGIHYTISDQGHKFEVHINDLPKFRRMGRGQDFAVGVAPPVDLMPVVVEVPAPQQVQRYIAPEPALAQLERLDPVAARSRGANGGQQAEPAQQGGHNSQPPPDPGPRTYDLSGLELGEKIQKMLEAESWTVETLAEARPEELRAYPDIGPKISERIIDTAKRLLEQQAVAG